MWEGVGFWEGNQVSVAAIGLHKTVDMAFGEVFEGLTYASI